MYMLQGKLFRPAEAAMLKAVDQVVPQGTALEAAREWVKANPNAASQPWDVKGYKIPGGTPSNPKLAQVLPAFPANLRHVAGWIAFSSRAAAEIASQFSAS